jgi:hypothetical protein
MNTVIFSPGILQIERYRIRVDKLVMRVKTTTLTIVDSPDSSQTNISTISLSAKLQAGKGAGIVNTVLSGGEFKMEFKPDEPEYWEYAKDADGNFASIEHRFDMSNMALHFHKVRVSGQGDWLRGEVVRDEDVKPEFKMEIRNRAERRRRKRGMAS